MFRDVAIVTALSFVGLALKGGFQLTFSHIFGGNADTDVYFAVFSLVFILRSTVGATINPIVIPAVSRLEEGGRRDHGGLALLFWLLAVAGVVISLALLFFSVAFLHALLPGFSNFQQHLAERFLHGFLWMAPLLLLNQYFICREYGRQRYIFPNAVLALNSAAAIAVMLLTYRRFGLQGAVCGVVAGELTMLSLLVSRMGLPALKGIDAAEALPELKTHLWALLPYLGLSLASRSTSLFEKFFASQLEARTISYLAYGSQLTAVFLQLGVYGIVQVVFPKLSREAFKSDSTDFSRTLSRGIFALVIGLGFIYLFCFFHAREVTILLFRHGRTTLLDCEGISGVLRVSLIATFLGAIGSVLVTALNAKGRGPALLCTEIAAAVVYIISARLMAAPWGYLGLAWAIVAQQIVCLLLYVVLLRRDLMVSDLPRRAAVFLGKWVSASLLPIALWVLTANMFPASLLPRLAIDGLMAAALYAGMGFALDIEELRPAILKASDWAARRTAKATVQL